MAAARSSTPGDRRPPPVRWRGLRRMPTGPGRDPPARRAVRPRRRQRRRRHRPRPRPRRPMAHHSTEAVARRPVDPRRCRPGPGPPRNGRRGTPIRSARPPRAPRSHLRRRRHPSPRPPPRRRRPTAVARPNPVAGFAGPADPPGPGEAAAPPRTGHPPSRRPGPRSAPSRRRLLRRVRVPPPDGPSPGTSGRQGTRSTGSTPPGARRPAVRAATRRSIGGDGPGSSNVHRGRRRTRRTDRPGHRPCWAALAQSSAR